MKHITHKTVNAKTRICPPKKLRLSLEIIKMSTKIVNAPPVAPKRKQKSQPVTSKLPFCIKLMMSFGTRMPPLAPEAYWFWFEPINIPVQSIFF